jgi:hypothetical protein
LFHGVLPNLYPYLLPILALAIFSLACVVLTNTPLGIVLHSSFCLAAIDTANFYQAVFFVRVRHSRIEVEADTERRNPDIQLQLWNIALN